MSHLSVPFTTRRPLAPLFLLTLTCTQLCHAQGAGVSTSNPNLLLLMAAEIIGAALLVWFLPRLFFHLIWGGNKNPFMAVRLAYMVPLVLLGALIAFEFYPRFLRPLLPPYGLYFAYGLSAALALFGCLLPLMSRKMPSDEAASTGEQAPSRELV